jgi:hypothetical protein
MFVSLRFFFKYFWHVIYYYYFIFTIFVPRFDGNAIGLIKFKSWLKFEKEKKKKKKKKKKKNRNDHFSCHKCLYLIHNHRPLRERIGRRDLIGRPRMHAVTSNAIAFHFQMPSTNHIDL